MSDNKNIEWTQRRTWKEFREAGLLWWINRILHTFGWAIAVELDQEDNVTECYPMRVKYRGFDGESEEEGFIKVSEYLKSESLELTKEAKL